MADLKVERMYTQFPWTVVVTDMSGHQISFHAFDVGYGVVDFVAQRGAWSTLDELGLERADLVRAVNSERAR